MTDEPATPEEAGAWINKATRALAESSGLLHAYMRERAE